jgi:hypothetical protein
MAHDADDRAPTVTPVDPGPFPDMPLDAWSDTKETLHRWVQIVGKLRLAHAPHRNHWWHVAFHLTARGITTRPMGRDPVFSVDFDFVDHRLLVDTVTGRRSSFPLAGLSVAAFYTQLLDTLRSLGVDARITGVPFDLADTVPFAEDTVHAAYDPVWATRYWRVLGEVAQLLEEFAGARTSRPARSTTSGTPSTSPSPASRQTGRPAGRGRPRHPRGVLPRGHQLRLLVRRHHRAGARVLLLHRPRARRSGRPAPAAGDGAVDGGTGLAPGAAHLCRRPRHPRPPRHGPRVLRERLPGRCPAGRDGTSSSW